MRTSRQIILVETAVIVAYFIAAGISLSFPNYISVQGVTNLMQALVTLDGVILGFTGIVYAQLFSSVMDQQNTIFEKMLSNQKQYSRCENFLKEYSKRKTALMIATIGTFTCLLSSILTSLIGLARISMYNPITDTYAPFGIAIFPMFFLIDGITVLVFALVALPMSPPKLSEKIKQTTLQE
jgi:hypothetical protein